MKHSATLALATLLVLPALPANATDALSSPYTNGAQAATILLDGTYPTGSYVSLSSASNLSGGDINIWNHSGVQFIGAGSEYVRYEIGHGYFPNGKKGTILNYTLETKHKDNGYLLVADSDVNDWVQSLGGNEKYVGIYASQSQTTMENKGTGDIWKVDWLPNVAALCGAKILFKGGASGEVLQVDPGGNTATPVFDVIPTPPPQASVSTKSSFTVGDSVPISLTAKVYAAATNWHMEAVHVTGPGGYDKYLPVDTGVNGKAAAANGTGFPYYGETGAGSGALATVYGGGSGDPSNPAIWNETATLDTSGLQPGTYTISYTLFDAVGRAASNGTDSKTQGTVKTTFTLQPGNGGGGSSSGSGSGGSGTGGSTPPAPLAPPSNNGVGKVLSMRFHNLPASVMEGASFVAPVEISNTSAKDVTTNLSFTLRGALPQKHVEYVSSQCTDANGQPTTCTKEVITYPTHPMTETKTVQITVPAHGVYTWNVSDNVNVQIQNGEPASGVWTLNAGGIGNSSGVYDPTAKYYPYLIVDAAQPELFVEPEISASIGTNYPFENPSPVRLNR